jgi:hypothetical protein
LERHQVLNCPQKIIFFNGKTYTCKNGVYPKEDEDIIVVYNIPRRELNHRPFIFKMLLVEAHLLWLMFELISVALYGFFVFGKKTTRKPSCTFRFHGLYCMEIWTNRNEVIYDDR